MRLYIGYANSLCATAGYSQLLLFTHYTHLLQNGKLEKTFVWYLYHMHLSQDRAGSPHPKPPPPSISYPQQKHMAHSHTNSSSEQLGFSMSSSPSHSESCCDGTAVQPLIFPQKHSHWYKVWMAARSISVAFCCLPLREKPLNCDGHSFPWKPIVDFITEWLKHRVAPQRIIWCGLAWGAYVSCATHCRTNNAGPPQFFVSHYWAKWN